MRGMDAASNHLHAELEERQLHGWAKARYWAAAVVGSLYGEAPAMFDLVVTRTSTGATVMRTPADLGDPQALLDQVTLDLETKTVAEFLAEWRPDVEL